jgi:phenylpropionate dioxygenase-like ring-hydroxylating dioxygenase large terminal subunit
MHTKDPATEAYRSPSIFERERDRVFKKCWLSIGRADDIPEPGDYFVRELPCVPASLVVVRGTDRRVRVFHNVCKHRSNRLLDGRGRTSRIVCNYHGWTYATDGRLVNVPDEGQFITLHKATCGLRPVNMELWHGFIFVNLAPVPTQDLNAYLDQMSSAFDDFPFQQTRRMVTFRAELRANWKTVMEIGRESYHIRCVHRATVPDSHTSSANPNAQKPYIRLFGPHARSSIQSNPDHKPSPAEAHVARHAPTVIQSGDQFSERPSCVNPAAAENWAFDSNYIFPNFGLILGPNWFVMDLFWPVDVNHTIWEQSYHAPRPQNFGERLSQEYSAVLTRDLLREDWAQVEQVQKGLTVSVLDHLVLSEQEMLIGHARQTLNQYLDGKATLCTHN